MIEDFANQWDNIPTEPLYAASKKQGQNLNNPQYVTRPSNQDMKKKDSFK